MKSFIRITSPKKVIKEYNLSFKKYSEFQKIKWSSRISMYNRYKLLFRNLRGKRIDNWIDVGSGTGSIFKHHEKTKVKIDKIYGLEINKKLFKYSLKKNYKKKILIINTDIIKFSTKKKFDLVSLIGVLQNCGHHPKKILKKCTSLLDKKGLIFITSKNINFIKFSKKNKPNYSHSWFNPQEIKQILQNNFIRIKKISGFNTNRNLIVPLKNSNTFFILGEKK